MKIISVCPSSFASNCYILCDCGHAVVIDPSVSVSAILNAAKEENAQIDAIYLTHGHFDHIISIDTLRQAINVKAYIHENDAEMLSDGKKNAFYTFFGDDRVYTPADGFIKDGDEFTVGNEKVKVLHTPGHSKGSVCYIGNGFMITGDTLFADSVGRWDLYRGDPEDLRKSLLKLEKYDRNLTIYPGHGNISKLGTALDAVAHQR